MANAAQEAATRLSDRSIPNGVGSVPERPKRANEVELLGELDSGAFRDQQWLVIRDGRFIQISELLYRILDCSDGAHTLDAIAADVGPAIDRVVSRENVEQLIRDKLIPLGLVEGIDSDPAHVRSTSQVARSPLAVNFRVKVDGRYVNPVAGLLRFLHSPAMVTVLLLASLVAHVWLYAIHGVTGVIRPFVTNPDVMMIVLPIMLLGALFHEFGHASALRYEGGRVRGMGAGLYLVFPALFTDVTESYRMSRRQRLRVDVGGPYFHVLFGLLMAGLYVATGKTWLLTVAVLCDIEVIRQFMPIGRLDGYWILADLAGIPDFLSRIVPFATSLLPIPIPQSMSAPALTRRARRVFLIYIAAFLVGFPIFLFYSLDQLPSLATAAWETAKIQSRVLGLSLHVGDYLQFTSSVFQLLFLAIEAAGFLLFFYLFAWRPARLMWVHSRTQLPALRRITRASLFLLPGGLLIAVGSLYPWVSIRLGALGLTRNVNGIQNIDGRGVLVAGIAVLLAGLLMGLSWTLWLRRSAAVVGLLGGVIAAAIAIAHLASAPGLVERQARAIVLSSTGHAPSAQELATTRETLRELGFEMTGGYGLYVLALGAAVTLGSSSAGLSGNRMLSEELTAATESEVEMAEPLQVDGRRGRAFVRSASISLAAAVVVATAFILWPSLRPTVPNSPNSPGALVGELIWPPNTTGLPERLQALGLPLLRQEALTYHVHQHLDIYVSGQRILIPAHVGIDTARGFITVLHTHQADGVIHVESPVARKFTLGQFFGVWGVRLNDQCLGSYCNHGDTRLRAYVNGNAVAGNPARIDLTQHEEIVLTFGTKDQLPASIPSTYRFPAGL